MTDTGIFAPHQDDETLTFLRTIRALEEGGHRVWVILMTNGINSGARAATGLSREEFSRARDDEIARAVRELGVPPERFVISPLRTADGELTVQAAEDMIDQWLGEHPGAAVRTTTNLGAVGVQHEDHRNAGQAAVNLLRAGRITPNYLRLGIEQYQLSQWKTANPTLATKVMVDKTGDLARVQAALDVYSEVDPYGWKFGIGGLLSVPDAFKLVKGNPVSYYHVPVL
jgi:LmbE family N-acetylglucosaminyl deacetylase